MRVASIVGARPQFIKAAVVSRELRKVAKEILIHTGQHYDHEMSEIFFEELQIPTPDYNLGVGSGSHGHQTSQMLTKIEDVLISESPDWLLIYGDTNSTLAGALAAAKLGIPIAHVEAGLRSFNRAMPEEINRVVSDHLSSRLFCPGYTAKENLAREGITRGVHVVGDVMLDVLNFAVAEGKESQLLEKLSLTRFDYLLATVHRAENTDNPERLENIVRAFNSLDRTILLPLHPRTQKQLEKFHLAFEPHIRCIAPVGYLGMVQLEKHAHRILTDSGGIQKEAYWLGVPCITMRDETEWVETMQEGWNTLVGADPKKIIDAVHFSTTPQTHPPLYGDGKTAQRIGDILVST